MEIPVCFLRCARGSICRVTRTCSFIQSHRQKWPSCVRVFAFTLSLNNQRVKGTHARTAHKWLPWPLATGPVLFMLIRSSSTVRSSRSPAEVLEESSR